VSVKEYLTAMVIGLLVALYSLTVIIFIVSLYQIVAILIEIVKIGALPHIVIGGLSNVEQLFVWFVLNVLFRPELKAWREKE
jgi:hypothetical protein